MKIVDLAVNQHLGRKLNSPEEAVIKGTWQKIGYKEMEKTSEFSRNYLMRDVAPRLWKLLSHVFGEPVNKHNFRSVLANLSANKQQLKSLETKIGSKLSQILVPDLASDIVSQELLSSEYAKRSQSWKKIIRGDFVGRSLELNALKQWIINDGIQLVSVLGITGIGKTTLCKKFVQLHQDSFDYIVWQKITQGMSLEELLEQLVKKVSYLVFKEYDQTKAQLRQLLTAMKEKRCLIILDGVETLVQSDNPNINYQEFWQKIALEFHQSCLLLNSLENPQGISLLEGEKSLVRSLLLSGLTLEDAHLFLGTQNTKQLSWNNIIEIYQGHPLALKIANKTIQDIFNGNAAEFVAQKAFIFGELEEVFDKLFVRLSVVEQEILYWLTIESKPISLSQIQKNIALVTNAELIESLVCLERRGLLETPQIDGQSLFALGSMIKAYISKKLIERVSCKINSQASEHNFNAVEEIIDLSAPANNKQVNLSNWLQGDFEADWQPIEKLLLNTKKLTSRLRGAYYLKSDKSVKRCKLIKIGKNVNGSELILLVEVKPEPEENISIRVQVYPQLEQSVLPANLQLSLINDAGESLRQVVSRSADDFIQLPLFRGKSPEKFSIELAIDDFSIQEDFVI